ncbi:MAG: chemotaxis protein MotB [Saprospiraceae bacterium]|jgi:chemotaxis protein MotB
MTKKSSISLLFIALIALSSCVSKKKLTAAQQTIEQKDKLIQEKITLLVQKDAELSTCQSLLAVRKEQLNDAQKQRDKQVEQVGDLTVLSKSANDNIKETLKQLEGKDKYLRLLQAARTKTDSINLALAINLKKVLKDGIDDDDINIEVDKTVVFINLSDKMLFTTGSYKINEKAKITLGKIAKIIEARPDFEVMVEGYTDSLPVQKDCIDDNWDLSVKRSLSVVRVLQEKYNINPNNLIAAGRGQYNALASNNTPAGRSTNRRTRIIIMPKLNQFYDLLNPNNAPE